MKLTAMTTAILLASIAVAGTSTQIANNPQSDDLGGAPGGVYRIPAMAKSTNGVIVAVYDCRYNSSGDLPNAIDIAECWSGDNGTNWLAPCVGINVANDGDVRKLRDIGDPCIVYDPVGNKFWLMAITGGGLASSHSGGQSVADVVLYTRGTGENDAWTEWAGGPAGNRRSVKQMILNSLAQIDPDNAKSDENQIRGILQGPGHGIVQRQTVYTGDGETELMPKDTLVFPMQYFPKTSDWAHESRAFAVYSTDGGETWKSTKLTPDGIIAQENCIMELDDGSWLMIAKGTSRQRFRTTDFVNWMPAGSHLPSEWVQGSCLRIGEGLDGRGRYAACFSPAGRNDVTLYFGIDTTASEANGTGVKWNLGEMIVYPGSTGGKGYNSLVMLDETTLGVLVEANGHIYLVKEDIGDILDSAGAIMTPPTPVAVWRGGFSSKHNGVALNLNGHASGGEGITIQDESDNPSGQGYKGVDVNFDSAWTGGMTVLFKYSGLSAYDTNQVLATSCVSGRQSSDRTGVRLLPDGTLNGGWNSSTSSGSLSDYGTSRGEICGSGCMAFTYKGGGSQSAGHGTALYQCNADGAAFFQAWGAEKLVSSSDSSSHWGATIGGSRGRTSGWSAAHGMTIEAIAVFDRPLSTDELDSFTWPYVADISTASISDVNASSENAPFVVLYASDGAVLTMDEPFTASKVVVVASGSLTLSSESQPSAEELAKLEISGVTGYLKRTWLESGTVGFNFNAANGNDTSGALVSGMWFSNRTDKAGSSNEIFSDGLSTLSWSSSTLYQYGSGSMVNGYLDDGENGGLGAVVSLSNVPYDSYDIVIYCATDANPGSFLAKTVNGRAYTWDVASGTVLEGTGSWGKSRHPAATYGRNALRIDGLSGPLSIYGNVKNGSVRGGIAAVQIMPHATPDRVARTHLTLDGGNVSWSAADWKAGDEDASAPVSGEVEITLAGSTTLTLDAGVWLDLLTVTGVPGAVLTMESGEGSSFTSVVVRVNGGVLRQGSDGIFSGASSVVVNEGATFDLNGRTFGKSTTLYLSGAGAGSYPWALTSSGGNFAAGSLAEIVLLADATVGGARNITFGTAYLDVSHIDFRGHKLTKIGSGTLTLLTCRNVVNGTGAIDIVDGTVATSGYTCLDGYETDYANTTVVVRKGATFRNGANGRFLWVHRLGQEAGGTIDTSSQPFAVESEFAGSGTTSKLRFASGALATLTGDLTIVGELKLGGKGEDSGSVSFARSQNLSVPVTVAIAGTFASEGSVSVGEGVILNLGTNRPPATLSFAADAGLVVKLMASESAVSLNAASLPSTFTLFDFDGSRVVNAKATFVDGTLSIAPHVAPESISINFHNGSELDSAGTAKLGIAGCGVSQDMWNSLIATNNATLSKLKCVLSNGDEITRKSMSATVSGTRGYWNCSGLSGSNNLLHGYMDDNDSYTTPTVTVTGVPYDKYRVVVYHSTDTGNVSFGYDLVNGIPFTGVSGHTSVGTMRWGNAGPSNSANAIEEGVNTLVTPILSNNAGKTLTVTGHRISGTVARGCIAAIQIFDASDEEDLANATNRFATVLQPGEGEWQFPEDVVVADPSGFGGVIVGTNGISHAFTSPAEGYANTAISVLAAIPESTSGTLVALGVKGSNDVQAKYNGDGTFFLTYNGMASGGETVTSRKVDVSGVHAYTLSYRSMSGTTLYQDDVPIATAPGIRWRSYGSTGSTDIGMRHGGGDVLSGLVVYAAYTHYWTTGNPAGNLFDTFSHPVFDDESATLAKKAEVFAHLAGYGDTEGLLALMPHRTSTYEHGGWHCPLDATFADGDYVDGLRISNDAVVHAIPQGVVTNAACASVLAEIPANASGVIANFLLVNGSSTHYAFAYANGDGTVSLGWEGGVKFATSASLTDWSLPHVWTFVNDVSGLGRLYRDDTLVVEATGLKFNNHKFTSSVTFGNTPNGKYPLAGMKVYAVHTDFGSSSAIFDKAEDNAASVFDTFDFMSELPEGATLEEKLEGFVLYFETGVAYEPPPEFDPEKDEVAEECVLRISEIMPKPTDAQNRGKLEGMDVNGLESGWVEVENTSDKWADLGDYRFIRVNRGKKTDPAGVGNFPTNCMVAPHSRAIFYTSERYSNSKEQEVSAFEHGTFNGKPMVMGAELHNILVWGDKVNPKKSPYVRLYYAPGGDSDKGTVVDTVVVPSDLPEGWSIIVGDAADDEGTRRWMCPTPTRGRANTATDGLKRIGPNVGPLYEKKGQKKTDLANEFAEPVPPAVPGTDYTVTLPINAVMNPDGTFTPRAADQIQSLKFVYRKDLDDTTLVTNVIEMATKNTHENWGDQYTATIPASNFPAAGHLMQWKVLITDGEGVEWTSPSFNNPDDGYEWYGTIVEPGELDSATLPTWHMFASGSHLTQMDYDKDDSRYTLENGARIAIYDSSTSNYYDYVRIDLRGNTSAKFTKKGHGLRFAKAHPLTMKDVVTGEDIKEIRKTSLISEFADPSFMRQMIAFWLFKKMGNHVPFDFPVRCNLNGEFYQLAFNSERFTDELIEDVYGLDKFGYGYKNVGTLKSGSGTTAGGIEKKTPDDEDESNITVLQSELRSKITAAQNVSGTSSAALSSSATDTTGLDNAALTKFVVQKFDLPAWLNYLASAKITQEMDDVWANICAYYDNPAMLEGARGKGTWMPLGYDFNISFGQYYQGDIGSKIGLMSNLDWFKSHPFYGGNRVRCWKQSGMTETCNNGNDGFEAVWQSAKFRRLYLRRLRTLMDQELKEPGTPESEVPFMVKMREMANLMRADSALDLARWPDDTTDNAIDVWPSGTRPADMDAGVTEIWNCYVVPRREHLYVTHSVTNTAKAIGYGSNLNAGIPEAQSPIEVLKVGFTVDNTTDETMTAIDDSEKVVIRNSNAEAVDMSGWQLTGRFKMTLPAGAVVDTDDTITVVVDRRAYIAAHDSELTNQVIVGNATLNADSTTLLLTDADGVKVLQVAPPSDESLYLRLHSFDGIPPSPSDGDEDEWITLTNISETATLDLVGVRVVFCKTGDEVAKCDFTIQEGQIAPLGSISVRQSDYAAAGWTKITNGELTISIYDANGLVAHAGGVVQKNHKSYRGAGGPGGEFFIRLTQFGAEFASDDFEEVAYPVTTVEVVPGEDAALEAATPEEAEAALADCEIVLSDEDKKEGLVTNVLKLVAVPVVHVDPSTSVETISYVARVEVDETKVDPPAIAEPETQDDKPVTVEEEGGKKVISARIGNAVKGLWYGYEVADELGKAAVFGNDVGSFERATNATHTVTASQRTQPSGFFRVKAAASKPKSE